jgi:hypothetical protein
MAFIVTRDFHTMLELRAPFVHDFYSHIHQVIFWDTHFATVKDPQLKSLYTIVIDYIEKGVLDKILTPRFAALYAELNHRCLDVTKQWEVCPHVPEETIAVTKTAFDIGCPHAVVNVHAFGQGIFLSEIVEKVDSAYVEKFLNDVSVDQHKANTVLYTDLLPQLILFTIHTQSPLEMMVRKTPTNNTHPVWQVLPKDHSLPDQTAQHKAAQHQEIQNILIRFCITCGPEFKKTIHHYIERRIPHPHKTAYQKTLTDWYEVEADLKAFLLKEDKRDQHNREIQN